ncbi:hypothetical protein NQ317_000105 [Molorchus minor]|uniref:Uncharacterized protein n=1 Tax=Molorchus minor TaxID=1323400 RepID=A0ABQ9IZL6_9CUCU|nr:hypothetical protein NQ317_000105 [Molorchus minor]
MEMLSIHRPQCQHNIGPATRDHLYRLPPVASVMDSYSRPSSADANFRNQQRVNIYSTRPSSVEELNDNYELGQFTNLDYPYNSPCHNYSGTQNYNSTGLDNGCIA